MPPRGYRQSHRVRDFPMRGDGAHTRNLINTGRVARADNGRIRLPKESSRIRSALKLSASGRSMSVRASGSFVMIDDGIDSPCRGNNRARADREGYRDFRHRLSAAAKWFSERRTLSMIFDRWSRRAPAGSASLTASASRNGAPPCSRRRSLAATPSAVPLLRGGIELNVRRRVDGSTLGMPNECEKQPQR